MGLDKIKNNTSLEEFSVLVVCVCVFSVGVLGNILVGRGLTFEIQQKCGLVSEEAK